jgi:HlyD family secretion protein
VIMDTAITLSWYRRPEAVRAAVIGSIVVVAVLATAALVRSGEATIASDDLVFAAVHRTSGEFGLSASGELSRQRRVAMQTPADGTLRAVHVNAGERVGAGTPLAVVENVDVELAARQANAELEMERADRASAEARLTSEVEVQRLELERAEAEAGISRTRAEGYRKLASAGLISNIALSEHLSTDSLAKLKVDAERRKLAALLREQQISLDAARSKLGMMEDAAKRANERVTELTLKAPFDGIVERYSRVAGEGVKRGDALASFASTDGMDAVVRVLERSASRVQVGMAATVSVGAQSVTAKVFHVDPQVEDGIVKVTLRPTSSLPPSALPGQRVEATIHLGKSIDRAVVQRPIGVDDDATSLVLRRASGSDYVEAVSVEFGTGSEQIIEVQRGLRDGDEIVVSDVGHISPGQRFRLEQ